MNCKHCGAPVVLKKNQKSYHCDYCGCYDFPDADRDGVTWLEGESTWLCPVCRTRLVKARVEGIEIAACPKCRGNLIEQPRMYFILKFATLAETFDLRLPGPPDDAERQRRIKCPGCRQTMETYLYGGSGNIFVQSCNACKLIWLDHGELGKIIRAYAMDEMGQLRHWEDS